MSNKLIIECDGKRYCANPELVSVHDGMATIAVKGSVPIYLPVTELSACNNGDCERHKLGAEPCADCPFCDTKGNI